MIHSFTVTFGAKYLTDKNHFLKFKFLRYVTYSFKMMLFISMGIFDEKFHPQILSVVPTANAPLTTCTLIS